MKTEEELLEEGNPFAELDALLAEDDNPFAELDALLAEDDNPFAELDALLAEDNNPSNQLGVLTEAVKTNPADRFTQQVIERKRDVFFGPVNLSEKKRNEVDSESEIPISNSKKDALEEMAPPIEAKPKLEDKVPFLGVREEDIPVEIRDQLEEARKKTKTLTLEEFKQGRKEFEETEKAKENDRKFLFELGYNPEEVPETLFPSEKPKELKTTFEKLGDFLFEKSTQGFDPEADQIGFQIQADRAMAEKEWLEHAAPTLIQTVNAQLEEQGLDEFDINEDIDREMFTEELNRQYEERFGEGAKTADEWFALLTIPATAFFGIMNTVGKAAVVGALENSAVGVIREVDEAIQTKQLPDREDVGELAFEAGVGGAVGGVAGGVLKLATKASFGRGIQTLAEDLTTIKKINKNAADKAAGKISSAVVAKEKKVSSISATALVRNRAQRFGISKEVSLRQLQEAAKESVENGTPFTLGKAVDDIQDGAESLSEMVHRHRVSVDSGKYREAFQAPTPKDSIPDDITQPGFADEFATPRSGGFVEEKFLNKAENRVIGREGTSFGSSATKAVDKEELDFMSKVIVGDKEALEQVLPVDKHAFPLREAKKRYLGRWSNEKSKTLAKAMLHKNKAYADNNLAKQGKVTAETFEEEAMRKNGNVFSKQIYENLMLGDGQLSTQQKQLREIAQHVQVSYATAEQYMDDHVVPLAKAYKAGEVSLETYENAYKTYMAIYQQAEDISSEFGRSFGFLKLPANSALAVQKKIYKQIEKAISDPTKLDAIAKRLAEGEDLMDPFQRHDLLMSLRPATTMDQIEEIFFNSILSSPATQIRNIAGNTAFLAIRELERWTGTAIEQTIAGVGRRLGVTDVESTRTFREAASATWALGRGISRGFAAFNKSFHTGMPVFQMTKQSDFSSKTGQALKGVFGDFINGPGRTLQATDDFYKTVSFETELAAGARGIAIKRGAQTGIDADAIFDDLLREPTKELHDKSIQNALVNTFTKKNNLAIAIAGIRSHIPGGKFFLPFVRTPVNIGEETLTRTPLGAINTVWKLAVRPGGVTLREFSDDTAKLLTGGAAIAGMYMAAERYGVEWNGSGPPEGSTERQLWLSSGRIPYSVTFEDGTSVDIRNFEPVSGIIGVMAELATLKDEGLSGLFTADSALTVMRAYSDSVLEKGFGQGFDNIFNILNAGDKRRGQAASRAIARTATGFIPYSGMLRTLDKIYGEPQPFQKTSTNLFTATGQEISKLGIRMSEDFKTRLGVDVRLPKMQTIRNNWGEVVIAGGILNDKFIDNTLLPSRVARVDPGTAKLNKTLLEWVKLMPEETIEGVSNPTKFMSFAKQKWELPTKEHDDFMRLEGQEAKKQALEFWDASWFIGMRPKKQLEFYNKQRRFVRAKVKSEMIARGLRGETEDIITLPEKLRLKFEGANSETINKHLEEITFE